jgi:hypothetical protein
MMDDWNRSACPSPANNSANRDSISPLLRLKNQPIAYFGQSRHIDIRPASAVTRPLCDAGASAGEFRCQ